ncbi:MAG: hypothetical protein AAFO76_13970 [Cyanobacteria bacterium J06607_15]
MIVCSDANQKNIVVSLVAISGLLTIPQVAQAKNIESYEDYRDYCSPAAYQYGIQSSVRYVNPVEDNTIDLISTEAGFAVAF